MQVKKISDITSFFFPAKTLKKKKCSSSIKIPNFACERRGKKLEIKSAVINGEKQQQPICNKKVGSKKMKALYPQHLITFFLPH